MPRPTKKISPYGTTKFETIDAYHVSFPAEVRDILKQLRGIIKQAAPQATECISYNMPTFKQHQNLVHYAAYKNHIGFYPTSSPLIVFKDALTKYKTSKGSVQFPIGKPLPVTLIRKMVKFRVKENLEKTKSPKGKTKDHHHYHKDGSLWAKGRMLNDQMHGYWEWFRNDGVIMRSGHFDRGGQIGEWITYDRQGRVFKITKIKKPG